MNSLAETEESGIASQRFFFRRHLVKSRARPSTKSHCLPRKDRIFRRGLIQLVPVGSFRGEKKRETISFQTKDGSPCGKSRYLENDKKNPRGIGSKCISGALCNWVFTRGGWKQCRSDAQGLNGSNSRETRGSITEGSEVRFFSRRGCGMGREIGRGATCWNRSGMKWEWFL